MKDELLQFYTNVAEESEGESLTSTPWVSSFWQRSSYPFNFHVNVKLHKQSPFDELKSSDMRSLEYHLRYLSLSLHIKGHFPSFADSHVSLVCFQGASRWQQRVNTNPFSTGLPTEETQRSGGGKQITAIRGRNTIKSDNSVRFFSSF